MLGGGGIAILLGGGGMALVLGGGAIALVLGGEGAKKDLAAESTYYHPLSMFTICFLSLKE